MLSIFSCASWLSVCPLWRNVFCLFLIRSFVFLILRCMSCLHILEINPMLVTSLATIFFYYLSVFFILFMVSFAVQKLLCLIRSHLFIFVFIFITLGDGSKKVIAVIYFKEDSACVFL